MKHASSETFGATLHLRPRPSRLLAAGLVVAHGLAAACLLIYLSSGPGALACCVVLAWSMTSAWRCCVTLTGRRAVTAATWHADGAWHLEQADGSRQEARLLGSTFMHAAVVVLHFRLTDASRRYLALCPDSLEPATLRRLRARLRVDGPAARQPGMGQRRVD